VIIEYPFRRVSIPVWKVVLENNL